MIDEVLDPLLLLDTVLEETIKDIGIPPRPEILTRISDDMVREDPNFRHLGQLISSDVGLSASLMKTVHSPFFGFHRQASSPHEAMMMLGLDMTSQAIAGICLRNVYPPTRQAAILLARSAKVAALSGWLAENAGTKKLRGDQAYTYGLFRDCGIPVMLKRFPTYGAVLTRANEDALLPFTQVEHLGLPDFPIDHALVGCLLTQDWWLPETICVAIRHHHEFPAMEPTNSGIPSASQYLIAIGQTAEYVFQQLTGDRYTNEWPKLGESCLRLLNLTEDELSSMLQQGAEILATVE